MKALLIPSVKTQLEGKRTELYNNILCECQCHMDQSKPKDAYIVKSIFYIFLMNGVFVSAVFQNISQMANFCTVIV